MSTYYVSGIVVRRSGGGLCPQRGHLTISGDSNVTAGETGACCWPLAGVQPPHRRITQPPTSVGSTGRHPLRRASAAWTHLTFATVLQGKYYYSFLRLEVRKGSWKAVRRLSKVTQGRTQSRMRVPPPATENHLSVAIPWSPVCVRTPRGAAPSEFGRGAPPPIRTHLWGQIRTDLPFASFTQGTCISSTSRRKPGCLKHCVQCLCSHVGKKVADLEK